MVLEAGDGHHKVHCLRHVVEDRRQGLHSITTVGNATRTHRYEPSTMSSPRMHPRQQSETHRSKIRTPLSQYVAEVPIVPADPATGRVVRTAPCHHHNTLRHLVHGLRVSTLEVRGKVRRVNWEVTNRTSVLSLAAAVVRAGVKSGLDASESMRSGLTIEAAGTDQAKGVSQAKSKSVDLTVSAARREAATGKAAEGIVNEKANAQVGKEEESDPVVSLGSPESHGIGANHASRARASLIAVLAMTVARLDQDEKSATDAEVEAPETTLGSDLAILQISHMAT